VAHPHVRTPAARLRGIWLATAAAVAAVLCFRSGSAAGEAADPFLFFRPSITVAPEERTRLDRGGAIARTLPAGPHRVAVFAAVQVSADRDRIEAWMRRVEQLKKSEYVLAIARFSDPPRLEDLDSLTLGREDLESLTDCRPGDCGLKLTADEILALQAAKAGQREWRPAVEQEFRRLLLRRVQEFHSSGYAGPARETAVSLLDQTTFLGARVPAFARYLEQYPTALPPGVESFTYWSKEQLGGKPVISATHVSVLRGGGGEGAPDVIVASRQIFAMHYMNGSLGLTMLLRGAAGASNYLVYVNRSDVDVVGGWLGGLIRPFLERRLKSEAAAVLQGLRRRLEGGEPASRTGDRTPPLVRFLRLDAESDPMFPG
jgi:hypothetical protein